MQHSADLEWVPRPVIALADEYEPGFVDPRHSHDRAQLLYAISGVMSVVTDSDSYIIPSRRAVWLPAGIQHEVSCRGRVSLRTLYIAPGVASHLPAQCRVIEVADLLRALILEATRFDREYDEHGRERKIVTFLLDEIQAKPARGHKTQMPRDERLRRVCRAILSDPARDDDLDYLAKLAGMGRRTLTRHFRQETGMSLIAWRQHVRLLEALSRLSVGQQVTTVAFDVGYESLSAFTAVFHKAFGVPPSRCFSRLAQ